MSHDAVPLQHPYERCASRIAAVVDDAAGSSPVYLTTEARRGLLVELSRDIARLEAMRLAVLAASGDVADEDAARSPGAWLAVAARLDRPEGARLQRLAEALDERYAVLAAAMLAGEVSRAQAEVVAAALDDLPDVDAQLRRRGASATWWRGASTSARVSCGCWVGGSSTWSPPRWRRSTSAVPWSAKSNERVAGCGSPRDRSATG